MIVGDAAAAERRMLELRGAYRTLLGPAAALVARYEADRGRHGPDRWSTGSPVTTARPPIFGSSGGTTPTTRSERPAGRWPTAPTRRRSSTGCATFAGVGRRFEVKGDVGGVVVLDDYGHHPTAIAATLDAVALRYPGRRIWAVYEPLTFHRTAAMLEPFADVLARADRVAIADIFAVRDPDTTIVSAADLAAAVEARGTPAIAPARPRPRPTRSLRSSSPATSSWSWAAAARRSSPSGWWRRSKPEVSHRRDHANRGWRDLAVT